MSKKIKYDVQQVSVGYNMYQNVIQDLSFKVNEGDFLSIIGPNGSGKSTIIKALCRIHKVNSGLILFDDKKIDSFNWNELMWKITQLKWLKIKYLSFNENKNDQKIKNLINKKDWIFNNDNWFPTSFNEKLQLKFTFNESKKNHKINFFKKINVEKIEKKINQLQQVDNVQKLIDNLKRQYKLSKKFSEFTSKELARHLAYVPQILDFPKNIKVYDFVKMGRFPYEKIIGTEQQETEIVMNALKTVEMESFANSYLEDLSGGQQQRCLIALALAQNTSTIVLDEPTNHLDIKSQLEIVNLLHKLNRDFGKTIILVIHDLNYSIRYANKVLVIKNGKKVAFGDTQEVITEELLKHVFDINTKVGLDLDNKKYVEYSWLDEQEEHYLNQDNNFDLSIEQLLSSTNIINKEQREQLKNLEFLLQTNAITNEEFENIQQKIINSHKNTK